jgi:hypothetical protein
VHRILALPAEVVVLAFLLPLPLQAAQQQQQQLLLLLLLLLLFQALMTVGWACATTFRQFCSGPQLSWA